MWCCRTLAPTQIFKAPKVYLQVVVSCGGSQTYQNTKTYPKIRKHTEKYETIRAHTKTYENIPKQRKHYHGHAKKYHRYSKTYDIVPLLAGRVLRVEGLGFRVLGFRVLGFMLFRV